MLNCSKGSVVKSGDLVTLPLKTIPNITWFADQAWPLYVRDSSGRVSMDTQGDVDVRLGMC